MVRETLDTEFTVAGTSKPFRLFTAKDCRDYARHNNNWDVAGLAAVIEDAELVTVGEVVAREEALEPSSCPRCAFENAVTDLVYAGTHIEHHYGTRIGQLNDSERQILDLAREWLADETITRCLEEAGDE